MSLALSIISTYGLETSLLFILLCVVVQHLLVQVSLRSEALLSVVSGSNKPGVAMCVNFLVCPMSVQGARRVRLSSGQ